MWLFFKKCNFKDLENTKIYITKGKLKKKNIFRLNVISVIFFFHFENKMENVHAENNLI